MNERMIRFVDVDSGLKNRVELEWGEKIARHMHLEDGFSILAMQEDILVGLVSVYWQLLPAPLPETLEGYIDILEVHTDFRRKGIATQLIACCMDRLRKKGAYQVRAWSSMDKIEAIPMWKALGFGLCPAITYPNGQEVRGYFVTRLIKEEKSV